MPRVKVLDLESVKERDAPIIVHTWLRPKDRATVLHISRQFDRSEAYISDITNCNRVMRSTRIHDMSLPKPDDPDFTLCSRCGTREDFTKAMAEYWSWRHTLDAKRKAQEDEERQQRELAAEVRSERLIALGILLTLASLKNVKILPPGERPIGALHLAVGEHTYRIEEVQTNDDE